MTCPHCVGAEEFFNSKEATGDLKRYRSKGPMKTAQMLIDALRDAGVAEKCLLDIGGGVGALQHELFKAGVASALERQGTRDRVEYHHGDFIDIASGLDEANVVTLDRVLCCYPDVRALVERSTTLTGSFYGVVYPRKSLVSKLAIGGANLFLKIKKNPFRAFVHDPERVDAMIREAGFLPRYQGKTLV